MSTAFTHFLQEWHRTALTWNYWDVYVFFCSVHFDVWNWLVFILTSTDVDNTWIINYPFRLLRCMHYDLFAFIFQRFLINVQVKIQLSNWVTCFLFEAHTDMRTLPVPDMEIWNAFVFIIFDTFPFWWQIPETTNRWLIVNLDRTFDFTPTLCLWYLTRGFSN